MIGFEMRGTLVVKRLITLLIYPCKCTSLINTAFQTHESNLKHVNSNELCTFQKCLLNIVAVYELIFPIFSDVRDLLVDGLSHL